MNLPRQTAQAHVPLRNEPARATALLLVGLVLPGCAGFFRTQAPPKPYSVPYTVPAPTGPVTHRPPVLEDAQTQARPAVTVGDTTTVFAKRPLIKVDEYGDPFTITAYQPRYFQDDEEYTPYVSCDVFVVEADQLARAIDHPKPGTTICIGDGDYSDLDLNFVGLGTATEPIVLSPRHPGKVVLRGRTHIGLAGSYLVVRGLRIEAGQSREPRLVEFRGKVDGKTVACGNCRASELVIRDMDRGRSDQTAWVSVFGQENRVDHSIFVGKANPGAMVETWRPGDDPDNHLVDHNLFAQSAPVSQDGEAIRIGTAAEQRSDSFTVVQDNLFEDLNGGDEYISSQSSAVAFLANTFRRCRGMLSLRHGDGDVVNGNFFLTQRRPDAGGIRITDGHHRVVNNYIEGVRTQKNDSGGLVLMSYDRGYTESGFQTVVHVLVAHNTLIDSEQSVVIGGGANKMRPKWVTLANNLIAYPVGPATRTVVGMNDWEIEGNAIFGGPLGLESHRGFLKMDPRLRRESDGLARPSDESDLIEAVDQLVEVDDDMDGQSRSPRPNIGADETLNAFGPQRSPLTREDVGPRTYEIDLP